MAVALVFDLTSRDSFDALPSWFAELETFAGSDVVRVVVANKADRDEAARVVSDEEGRAFAASKNAEFVEVSAKQGRGVDELFESMVDRVRRALAGCADCADPREARAVRARATRRCDDGDERGLPGDRQFGRGLVERLGLSLLIPGGLSCRC